MMTARWQKMRVPVAMTASVVVTLAIFVFMQHLIGGRTLQVATDNFAVSVDIYQPPAEEKTPPPQEPPPVAEQAPASEPVMAPLSVSAPAPSPALKSGGPAIASFAPAFDDVALDSGAGGIFGSGAGDGDAPARWSPPGDNALARKIAEADKKGAEGYREIRPFSSRQPNVPEYAWKNHVDGWVLVTFTVNRQSRVENVRVLDSQPPGVFDENVVAAVSDWLYDPEDIRRLKGKVQLTQRIEVFWKDYPNNNQQLK